MGQDFKTNVDIPVDMPRVKEYAMPEGDEAEKTENAIYNHDAAVKSLELLRGQFIRRRKALDRAIDDIDEELKG
jgi:hypothetical protein